MCRTRLSGIIGGTSDRIIFYEAEWQPLGASFTATSQPRACFLLASSRSTTLNPGRRISSVLSRPLNTKSASTKTPSDICARRRSRKSVSGRTVKTFLINPDHLDPADSLAIIWVRSGRKLLSATNHDMQGIGSDLMTLMITSFLDANGGCIDLLEKLYVCTTIPYGVLMGRPLIENAGLRRFGDSANGVQRFGDFSSPFMPPPERRPQGQRVKVPVWAILDTLLKLHTRTTIPCTTDTLFSSSTGALKVRSAEVATRGYTC